MNNLREYIIEKLKINKDSKIQGPSENFVFVVAFNEAYGALIKDYADVRIESRSGEPDGFIIPLEDIKSYCKKYNKPSKKEWNIIVYRIPDNWSIIADFIDAYKNGEVFGEDLEIIEDNELK